MHRFTRLASLIAICLLPACGGDSVPTACCAKGSLRVVNGFTGPVDVMLDGNVAIPSLAAGAIATVDAGIGGHGLTMRPTGSQAMPTSLSITTTSGATNTFAALRSSSGSLSSAVLDDTNSVVPTGATKVRVLHMAPNAGTLQVFRTQPDFQQHPVSWQFPFNYQATIDPLSAPFYQSTVGTWEVHIWQVPADSSGWSTAPVKVLLPLASGEKRTIIMLDKAGGGVRVEIL